MPLILEKKFAHSGEGDHQGKFKKILVGIKDKVVEKIPKYSDL